MAIADQALNEAKRGAHVVLIVSSMRRAEDLSAAWRKSSTDISGARGGAQDIKIRSAGTVHFVSAGGGSMAEAIAGRHGKIFIEPDAIDMIRVEDWSLIRNVRNDG